MPDDISANLAPCELILLNLKWKILKLVEYFFGIIAKLVWVLQIVNIG